MIVLPSCSWRGPLNRAGRFACSCPKLIAPRGVTAALCVQCPYAGRTDAEAAENAVEVHDPGHHIKTCRQRGRAVRENGKPKTRLCMLG